jgi:hypothetical protein
MFSFPLSFYTVFPSNISIIRGIVHSLHRDLSRDTVVTMLPRTREEIYHDVHALGYGYTVTFAVTR